MGGIDPKDMSVIFGTLAVVCLIFLTVDFIIFFRWLSFKYKENTYQEMYGPVLRFPPRTFEIGQSDEPQELPVVQPAFAAPEFDFLPTAATNETPTDAPELEEPAQAANRAQPDAVAEPAEEFPTIDPNLLSATSGLRSPFAATWSLVHPFLGIQALMLALIILEVMLILPAAFLRGQDAMQSPYGMGVVIFCLFLQNAGFVGMTAFFLKLYGTSLAAIGLRKPTAREIGLGIVFGACLTLVASGFELGLDAGMKHLLSKHAMSQIDRITKSLSAGGAFDDLHGGLAKVMFAIGGAVAAPIGEEVFFRGLLYNGLKRRWGVTAGVLISALCFAVIHAAPTAVLVIIPMGIVLALAYEYTGSLWVTILMHAINNTSAFILSAYTAKPGH